MTAAIPHIGFLPAGTRNLISDVPGVTVGHSTLALGHVQTGVTVIRPHQGDPYRSKVPAACAVLNGFGKSVGLVQVAELGTLETPIALTNALSVNTIATAQIRAAIAGNPRIGREEPTVNPLVFECNDGYLNDIQALAVQEAHYQQAFAGASAEFQQGAIGAGRGMSCFELKGGIGSASRRVRIDTHEYHIGTLVLANFGKLRDLILAGERIGPALSRKISGATDAPEKGSIILVVATDAPLDARQLRRLALRAGAGLARTGSVFGHGSGDIALAFSTAQTIPHTAQDPLQSFRLLHETLLDPLFHAVADSAEQAIVHALFAAETITGRDGHQRTALRDLL
ncbi:MAG: P1 family peptidase [Noviherbaspirillum sp.]